jgi:hydroxymethylpyrimidine/phosphomethylpyrimidine kinase
VLDPVRVAASGDPLIADDAVEVLRAELFPRAALVTPNLYEAARLLGENVATSREAIEEQAAWLLETGAGAVLLKGGHGEGPEAADLVVTKQDRRWLTTPRIATQNTHGTGCTLSSAIAAELAKGANLFAAVEAGKAYTHAAIAAADRLRIGSGHGPVHHFHALWGET